MVPELVQQYRISLTEDRVHRVTSDMHTHTNNEYATFHCVFFEETYIFLSGDAEFFANDIKQVPGKNKLKPHKYIG